MPELSAKLLAAYFLGGLMGGDLMRRLLGGADLRDEGSGNVGATNALRSRGPAFAMGVLLIDVGKGVLGALALPAIGWPWAGASTLPVASIAYLCGIAVVSGHCFPVLLKFRGGKGVATAVGVIGALFPAALPWVIAGFALIVMLTGHVALASIGGALIVCGWVSLAGYGALSPAGDFVAALTILIIYKHRSNLSNLWHGREHRFEKARVLGRLIDRWRGR